MIFITGDTHRSDLGRFQHFCILHPELSKRDYMIVAGDFGGVWAENTLEHDLAPFSALPFTVLFVDGNHENFDLLDAFPVEEWQGGRVHRIRPDIIHLMRGQVYELEGKRIFTFGGATSIDRAMRTEGVSWWRQELPTCEQLDEGLANLKRCGNHVDVIVTHSCGERAFAHMAARRLVGGKGLYPENHLFSNFEDVASFGHWYFGHFHADARLGEKYTALLHEIVQIS